MRWKETLYQRRLRRRIDRPMCEAIHAEFLRRRHQIPIPTELHWHQEKPQFTIRSSWFSFVIHYTHEFLVVDAELSLAARWFATQENRAQAVRFIESLADDLGL